MTGAVLGDHQRPVRGGRLQPEPRKLSAATSRIEIVEPGADVGEHDAAMFGRISRTRMTADPLPARDGGLDVAADRDLERRRLHDAGDAGTWTPARRRR